MQLVAFPIIFSKNFPKNFEEENGHAKGPVETRNHLR